MQYTKREVTREAVQQELIAYLQERVFVFRIRNFTEVPTEHFWVEEGLKTGQSVTELIETVYQRLLSSGRIKTLSTPTSSSLTMHLGDMYYLTTIKTIVLEEIAKLVRAGVLLEASYSHPNPQNYDLIVQPDKNKLILTEIGAQFVSNHEAFSYEATPYVTRLRTIAEPDGELIAYLGEGLACLQFNLARAAAVLLRLSSEHTLSLLIEAVTAKIPDEPAKKDFQQRINKARVNIELRANTCFDKLSSDASLLTSEPAIKRQLETLLRPAFHAIRELGGDAAHPTVLIDTEQVRHHYYIFAETVYKVTMKIIQHLQK